MFKKSLLIVSVIALFGCGSSNYSTYSSKPKYKISDEDIKRWIIEENKLAKCLFPEGYKKRSKNESLGLLPFEVDLYWGFVMGVLEGIIGKDNVQVISTDLSSRDYFVSKLSKFNNTYPVKFDQKWCEQAKKEYDKALSELVNKLEKEAVAYNKQLEKERKTREEYYANPQVQSELAHQRQKEQYQQQLLAQQMAYQQQLQAQRQRQDFKEFTNTINKGLESITNSMYKSAKLINSTNNVSPSYQFQSPQSSSTTCYRLNNIVRCNHR